MAFTCTFISESLFVFCIQNKFFALTAVTTWWNFRRNFWNKRSAFRQWRAVVDDAWKQMGVIRMSRNLCYYPLLEVSKWKFYETHVVHRCGAEHTISNQYTCRVKFLERGIPLFAIRATFRNWKSCECLCRRCPLGGYKEFCSEASGVCEP